MLDIIYQMTLNLPGNIGSYLIPQGNIRYHEVDDILQGWLFWYRKDGINAKMKDNR